MYKIGAFFQNLAFACGALVLAFAFFIMNGKKFEQLHPTDQLVGMVIFVFGILFAIVGWALKSAAKEAPPTDTPKK